MWKQWGDYLTSFTQTVAPTVDSPFDQFREEWLRVKSFYISQKSKNNRKFIHINNKF